MTAVEQWKIVEFYFKLKKQLKEVTVILREMFEKAAEISDSDLARNVSVLNRKLPIWQSETPRGF